MSDENGGVINGYKFPMMLLSAVVMVASVTWGASEWITDQHKQFVTKAQLDDSKQESEIALTAMKQDITQQFRILSNDLNEQMRALRASQVEAQISDTRQKLYDIEQKIKAEAPPSRSDINRKLELDDRLERLRNELSKLK